MFVATKVLSKLKQGTVLKKFCRNKHTFVATKMILLVAPDNDRFRFFPSACLSFTQCPPAGAQISMSSKTKDESCGESHLHQCPDVTTSRPPRMRGERIERQWCRARQETWVSKAKAKQDTRWSPHRPVTGRR